VKAKKKDEILRDSKIQPIVLHTVLAIFCAARILRNFK